MASLELDTYEISEPYQTNVQDELHAVASEKQKPDQAGCSRWIIGCAIIIAILALCVSVATLVLLYTTGVFTSAGLKAAQLDMPTNKPGLTDSTDAKVGSTDMTDPKVGSTDVTDAKATSVPQLITKKASTTSKPTEPDHVENQFGGSTYVRWGRTVCPETSSLVYAGLAGGKWFHHTGSGSNYLCLPHDPEYDDNMSGVQDNRAFIHSAEYQTHDFNPFSSLHDHDVPCAVCHVINRVSVMFPAKMTCQYGWTREYHVYLMADYYKHSSTEFVCVDRNPEIVPGSISNKNGALFYPTEGRCDSNLPCSPYIEGAELTCVVCSK